MHGMAVGTQLGRFGTGGWGLLGLLHAWFSQLARPVPQDEAITAFLADVAELLAAPDAEVWVRGSHGGWRLAARLGGEELVGPQALQEALAAEVGPAAREQGPRLWVGCRLPGPGGVGAEEGRWLGTPLVTDRDLHGVMVFRRSLDQPAFPMDLLPLVAVAARPLALVLDHQRLKDGFLAVVSHELRTPLATMKGFVELLEVCPMAHADQIPLLQVMKEEGERLGRMIEDLLDLSRLQAGQRRAEIRKTRARGLLTRALAPWTRHPDHAARLTWEVVPAGMNVVVDPELFTRVVVNLVGNAYRYAPSPAPIHVAVQRVGSGWLLEVTDRGPGLDEDVRARLGEAFVRGGNVPAGGTGLGLAITRAMLDLHGARLEVEAPAQGGTRFRCRFPMRPREGQ